MTSKDEICNHLIDKTNDNTYEEEEEEENRKYKGNHSSSELPLKWKSVYVYGIPDIPLFLEERIISEFSDYQSLSSSDSTSTVLSELLLRRSNIPKKTIKPQQQEEENDGYETKFLIHDSMGVVLLNSILDPVIVSRRILKAMNSMEKEIGNDHSLTIEFDYKLMEIAKADISIPLPPDRNDEKNNETKTTTMNTTKKETNGKLFMELCLWKITKPFFTSSSSSKNPTSASSPAASAAKLTEATAKTASLWNSNVVLVEIRRMSGPSATFQTHCRTLLHMLVHDIYEPHAIQLAIAEDEIEAKDFALAEQEEQEEEKKKKKESEGNFSFGSFASTTNNNNNNNFNDNNDDYSSSDTFKEENDAVVSVALSNYETFHNLPRGSVTVEEVASSSAGIAGWATYKGTIPSSSSDDAPSTNAPNSAAVTTIKRRGIKSDEVEKRQILGAMLASVRDNVDASPSSTMTRDDCDERTTDFEEEEYKDDDDNSYENYDDDDGDEEMVLIDGKMEEEENYDKEDKNYETKKD